MSRLRDTSRRSIIRLVAATLTGAVCHTASAARRTFSPEEAELVNHDDVTGPVTWSVRNYSIHATILLGSIPVLSKDKVGGACLALETAGTAEAALTSIQFVAGTWPEMLKGFNRLGATQEVARECQGAVAESAYLSFMSTTSEKGFNDGRRAMSFTGPVSMYSIARGRSTSAGCTFELRHRPASARCNWSNCIDLLHNIADWGPLPPLHRLPDSPPSPLPTFLCATRRALQSGEPVLYHHNGDVYRLSIKSEPAEDGGRMSRFFLAKVGEKHQIEFRLWFKDNDGSGFPVRIEFHPKSFLKLTLEAEPSLQTPVLRPMLGQS